MSRTPGHLGHVNIYVRDADVSKKWYEEMLGLHTYDYVPGRAAFMSANKEESHEVAVMQLGPDATLPQSKQVGLNHMAWRMDSLEDLKEFYVHIKKSEWPIGQIIDHGISLGIYFPDPDGNGVEVYYEAPRSEWHTQFGVFMGEGKPSGKFPGPWDEEISNFRALRN